MSEPVVIDGWKCELLNGDTRCVKGPDGAGATLTDAGASFDAVSIPPAVLAWLIRPLLHEAWEDGAVEATDYYGHSYAESTLCVGNPHKDP